ncbi:hypothetical protein GGR51DRAFT_540890 [Nemania sp. FL0031]|nr:hypothetical protein GGR51DRAFT_540890 [Nemania sp. FL0031]
MAATNETSFPDRNLGWYADPLTEVNDPIRKLLKGYSGIPDSEVVTHVNDIRDQGFQKNPYPCIGQYRFTKLTLIDLPVYDEIVRRLKKNETYLDIGCCFGQDLRQLVFDGAPSDRLIGLDITPGLPEVGYNMFRDRQKLKAKFIVADVFKGSSQEEWAELERDGIDIVHCSAFFHLFTLDKQLEAARHIAKLVKKGGMIVGRQIGSEQPGNAPAIQQNTESYRHDVSTFEDMWRKVGEDTKTKWEVEGSLDKVGVTVDIPTENEHSRRLLFTVRRVE